MRTVAEHLDIVLRAVHPVESETVSLTDALGRTLAAPITARVDIPVFDNSAMDGFAVRFADVASATTDGPARLRVVADLPAGTDLDPALGHGEAARIMTGSPVPSDSDAIVPFEDTVGGLHDSLTEIVVTVTPRAPGAHIRHRGEDAVVGDEIVAAGIVLGGFQISAAAAAGATEALVARRPRVAVISTGSELAAAGSTLRHGQIPESNSLLLAGLVTDAGADLVLRDTVADDIEALRAALAAASALGADVVITSGGVSAGAYEVVKDTLGPGGELEFAQVAMQPGKPQGFGRLADGALVFGLPGNPVSVAASFEAFARPALLAMQGRRDLQRPILRMRAEVGWRTPPGRRQYLPAAVDRRDPAAWTVRPATRGGSGSHLAGGLARAEAFVIVDAGVEEIAAGDAVDVMLIP